MKRLGFMLAAAAVIGLAGASLAQAPPAAVRGTTSLTQPADAPPVHPTPPGPYAVTIEANPGLMTHTIYRPIDMKAFTGAKRLPIIAWGNGACSNAGLLFSTFLSQVASHGYIIIASGPKDAPLPAFAAARPGQTSVPAPPAAAPGSLPAPMTRDADMQTALDWATRQNADKASPYSPTSTPTGWR